MKTYTIFWDDCYKKEFTAKIININNNEIILDKTCFYPQGGGQPGDTGSISGIKIIDTQKVDSTIVHIAEADSVNTKIIKSGIDILGKIDFERRYKIMRLHSSSHIMEYFLFEKFGKLDLVSAFISENNDRSTYQTDLKINNDSLKSVEDKVNDFIAKNYPIQLYSSKSDPDVRYWECEHIKYPCGGTHPKNTKEIGKIKVKRKSGGKGKHLIITSLEK